MSQTDSARQLLRHAVATLAYRAAKPLSGAPDSFCKFKASADARTPVEILAHMGDLFEWALSVVRGEERWGNATPLPWREETRRFFGALQAFDAYLASDSPLHAQPEKLFQAPIADALTHVGQIAMLRRLAGAPVRGENYYVAEIAIGRVGADQPAPVQEFT
jgi:hypothetical protein